MKKFLKVMSVVLVIAMLGAFASCGGNSGNDTTAAPEDTTAAKAAVKVVDIALTDELYAFGVDKKDTELQTSVNDFVKQIKSDGTLEKVIAKYYGDGEPTAIASAKEDSSKDQLVVATNATFAPFEYMDGDSYYGIDMEIMKLLADKLGKELVIKNIDFDAVCTTVDQGYADIAAAGLTVNEARKEFVTFSESYYTASQMVIAKADDTTFDACKTADEITAILNGFDKTKKIGVQTGTIGQYFTEGDADWGFEGFKVTCTGYQNGALAVQDLINGGIDYVIIDEAPAKMIAESFNNQAA